MRIKKEDVKKINPEEISELVGTDGGTITGDDVDNYDSQIKTAPSQTTDDYEESGIQANDFFYNAAYLTGGSKVRESISKQKMNNIIEDLVKKSERGNIVRQKTQNSMVKTAIGNIDTLDSIVGNKLSSLLESVDNANGNTLAVVLNSIIETIDLTKIPNNILNEIKNKINA